MNIKVLDLHLNGNCNDLNKILKLKSEERKKILLLSQITKNERIIESPRVNAPHKLNNEIRKKISLENHRNENKEINNPINNINNLMIVNNYRIGNLRTENNSVDFGKLHGTINANNSLNYIDNNKSQMPDMRKRINEIYGVSPRKESRNIEFRIGGFESDRKNFNNNLLINYSVKKEEKGKINLKPLNSKNNVFKFVKINNEKREGIRSELEEKLLRQKSEIERREKESLENIKNIYLQDLIKNENDSKNKLFIQPLVLGQEKLGINIELLRFDYIQMMKLKEEEEERKRLEEQKIQNYIEYLKKIAKEEEKIKLNEDSMKNNDSKHKYRLQLLNRLTKQYLKIYKNKDRLNKSKILDIINKIGKIFKREIDYDKEFKKDSFIYVSDAVQSNDFLIKFLGTLGEEFRKYNIYSIIEKNSEDEVLMDGIFKVLLCVYSVLPKYEIKLESESLKKKFLNNPKEWLNFIDNFKQKITAEFNITNVKFFIFSNRIDSFEFTFVILGRTSLNLERYEKFFKVKIRKDSLLEYVKLSPGFFETKYNRDVNDWEKENFKRGGETYTAPNGWKGFALKVLNKFDNGNNAWLGNEGKEDEWAIAYHGIGKGNEFKKLLNIVLNNLRNGPGQLYEQLLNIRYKRSKRTYVGRGVYLAPDINEAERYAQKVKLGNRENDFQFIIMCRVKPSEIREPGRYPFNWILDASYDCLRPYRILIKET